MAMKKHQFGHEALGEIRGREEKEARALHCRPGSTEAGR